MPIKYIGIIDGHNTKELVSILEKVKNTDEPVIIHTYTQKGKGYKDAEENPDKYHGVSRRIPDAKPVGLTYSAAVGQLLQNIADNNHKVVAISAAMLSGCGLGDNAKAGLISRALVEMRRFVVAFGANEDTIYGLTGVGDLVVTTTSMHSRNFQAGYRLATGKNLEETISSMTMVVEGARTVVAAYQYARVNNIDTPIIDAVYDVLYNKKPVKTAINQLMKRSLKDE